MKFSFNRPVNHVLKTWKRRPTIAWMLSILWLLLIGWLAFFWNLGSTGLLDETEPLFAEAARQMTVTGDWITPFFNGEPRFDKPPLIYWLMAIAYHTFGVNEFATRLPSALAGFALTGFCFFTLRYFGTPSPHLSISPSPYLTPLRSTGRSLCSTGGTPAPQVTSGTPLRVRSPLRRETLLQGCLTALRALPISPSFLAASLGAAMVALNPYTLFFGRTGYSDMLLSANLGGALLAFFLGYAQPERQTVQARWYLACYVLIALAVLTKGPVAVVLAGLIIGSFLLYVGRARQVLREMRIVRGALIVLALSLPWYILVILQNGNDYIDSFFIYHNFERFTTVVNHHRGPWYFHFLVVLLGFAPWSIGLPIAIAQAKLLQRRHWQNQPRSHHLGLFAVFWFLIILGFFTIAVTKYFSYTLPLIPAAAILMALWWSRQIIQMQSHQAHGRLKLTSLLSIIFFVVLATACFLCPQWLGDDPSMPNLGLRIQQAGLSKIGAAIWGASAIAGTILLLQRQTHWLWGVKFLGFVAFLIFLIMPASAILDAERQLPLRQIAQSVIQVQAPGEKLVMISDILEKPSVVFYTQRELTFLERPAKVVSYIQRATKRSGSKSVLLIATRKSLQKTGLEPNQYQEISHAGVYQLVRVSRSGVF